MVIQNLNINSQLKIKISGKSYKNIQIYPESWFNIDIVNEWKKGPFRDSYSESKFSGENSPFNLIPKSIHLIYQPSVTFYLNKDDKNLIESKSSSSFGFNFGFISFNQGSSKTSVESTERNDLFN